MARSVHAIAICAVACGRIDFEPAVDDSALAAIGCSDGQREAFVQASTFPTIAGCGASWVGMHGLRELTTGAACGDDLGPCAAPADACAAGWRICADNGDPADLSSRLSMAQCANGGGVTGAFVAASGHCAMCTFPCNVAGDCQYVGTYSCSTVNEACAEPLCCGPSCAMGNCRSALFPDATRSLTSGEQCGMLTSMVLTGVLCCKG